MGNGLEDRLQVKVRPWAVVIPDSGTWQAFDCDPDAMPAWTEDGAVREHGLILREKLESHPAVASALQKVLSIDFSSRHPIYFQIQGGEAERFRWEALWDNDKEFLALDARWPIARMVEPPESAPKQKHLFTPPLRVMALMSALGRPAKPQWKELYAAVEKTREQGLDVELSVFFGEEDLLAAVRKDIEQGTVTGVRAGAIDNPAGIEAAIDDFKPHILHFFCHGSASVGRPQLELAKITDHDLGKSSVILGIKQLAGFQALSHVWLVTLNCCEGGKSVADLHSMAHQLVVNVVPAAIGMLEPIDAGDAHRFCGAFYAAVFRMVRQFVEDSPPEETEIEWAETLHSSRTLLSQSDPGPVSRVEWTLPVLYVRRDRFEVTLKAPPSPEVQQSLKLQAEEQQAMKLRAESIATVLRGLAPDTPAELRDEILATLNDLPLALRPDRHGNFQEASDKIEELVIEMPQMSSDSAGSFSGAS